MSSYDPIEDSDERTTHDPGVHEGEIVDERDFTDWLDDLDRVNYAEIGGLAGVLAGVLTAILVVTLFPEYQSTAGRIVRWIFGLI